MEKFQKYFQKNGFFENFQNFQKYFRFFRFSRRFFYGFQKILMFWKVQAHLGTKSSKVGPRIVRNFNSKD